MELGPVQIIVVGMADAHLALELLPELHRLRDLDGIRLIDLVLLDKDEEGRLRRLDFGRAADRPAGFGDLVERLVGLGPDGEQGLSVGPGAGAASRPAGPGPTQTWAVSDSIPPGTPAVVLLIEHPWAIPLRHAIDRAGGFALEDTWVHPGDLIARGAALPGRR